MKNNKMFVLMMTVLFIVTLWACESAFGERIVAWGWNYYGQCDVPAGNDFTTISACWKHSLALRSNGSVAGWGQNNQGQSNSPEGNDFLAIAAGQVHSLALKSDGSLVAWGYNGHGECDVPAGNNFVAIAAGYDHNLAITSDGSLVAWGDNHYGQCNVPAGNNFVAIAAGSRFSLALKSDGSLVAWGDNSYGQCNVPSGNDFVAIAAGSSHSLALKADGSLMAWGRNDQGQCNVPSGNDFVAIAAGSSHSVALLKEPATGQPIADAGNDIVASANEQVTLDGSKSYDSDGQIILYTWKRLPDNAVIYSGTAPTCQTRALGRAEEVIELTVTDNNWLIASDTLIIINRILQELRDQITSRQAGDLNRDRKVNLADFALLAQDWLK